MPGYLYINISGQTIYACWRGQKYVFYHWHVSLNKALKEICEFHSVKVLYLFLVYINTQVNKGIINTSMTG